ncbi:hypothetical protein EV44_g3575 [Erysiphe necator]|uniref:Uncharacterized protein n=1 Tax=Uncinula necator TaxID=52586 RepID=A0A0B1P0S3_UNCNE|nr:hypothetical protein EV44_g3575 [Erysiphe necator]
MKSLSSGKVQFKTVYSNLELKPLKSKSSPSRGAGVNAQYALHVWDSPEDSHNPSFPSGSPIHPRRSQSSSFLHHFPLSTFFHEAPLTIDLGSME